MQAEEAYKVFAKALPVLWLAIALAMTHNQVNVRWIGDLNIRRTILNRIRNLVPTLSIDDLIHEFILLFEHQEHIDGYSELHGTRPFLVAMWRWIIIPFSLVLIVVAGVLILIGCDLYNYVAILLFITIGVVSYYNYLFDRFEKQHHTTTLE